MIKTILVPTSGGEMDARVFNAALCLARPLRAHLKFLHVRLSACEAAMQGRQEAQRSADAEDQVHAFCAANDIALRSTPGPTPALSAEILEETDQAEARLLAHARHSDLLVLGRPSRPDYMPYDLIEKLLLGSGRPIVIAPDATRGQPSGTVVVAWQETPAAARALSAALPLIKRAHRVVLLNVDENGTESKMNLDRVAMHLSWHGIIAETRFLAHTHETSAQILLQAALELNPELLVGGGHGHQPLHEAIFGGVTVSLLSQSEALIFVMH